VRADGHAIRVVLRVDTPGEADYLWHGGILPFVVRALADG
jgi:aconitate hydratase